MHLYLAFALILILYESAFFVIVLEKLYTQGPHIVLLVFGNLDSFLSDTI